MSKRHTLFAKDLRPGDTVRLVYEITITSVDDLDTLIPSESPNMLVLSGSVIKGPMRGKDGTFAILGDEKVEATLRAPLSFKLTTPDWIKVIWAKGDKKPKKK